MSRWLINISGARPDILAMCPTERVKFLSLGWAMLIAGGIAAASMWVALTSFIGLNAVLAVPIAGAAGLIVLGADRWLLVTLPASDRFRWARVLPRLIFTMILGVIIATPLVVRVFQPEINSQIALMKEQRAATFLQVLQNSSIGQQVASLTREVDELDAVIALGPKNPARYHEAQSELPVIQRELLDAIRQRDTLQNTFYAANNADTGWLLRLQALDQLAAGNSTLDAAVVLLALLFIVLESLPVSVKLLQQPGTYERILAEAARRELLSARKALLGIPPAQARLHPDYGYQLADADIRAIWRPSQASRPPLFALEPSDATEPELEPAESYEHTGLADQALAMLEDSRASGQLTPPDGIPLRWDDDDL
jgi:hypothetical protein